MFKKILKILMYLLLVVLSPLALVAILSAAVIVVCLASGENFSSAIKILTTLFQDIYPFLPYITGIPALLVVVILISKYHKRIFVLFKNR